MLAASLPRVVLEPSPVAATVWHPHAIASSVRAAKSLMNSLPNDDVDDDEYEDDDEDEGPEIEVRVRLQLEDYLHAWFYVPSFRTVWQYILFMPIGFALIVVGSPAPWRESLSFAPWVVASVVIGVVAAWLYRNYWAGASFNRVGPRQIVYRFDPDGMEVSSSFGTQLYPWDEMVGAVESPRALLVFLHRSQFFLVPKRSFSEPELAEVAELLATIPRRSGGKRILRAVGIWFFVCAVILTLLEVLRA